MQQTLMSTGQDPLSVSLHDDELAHEVELIARLMVAANETDAPLLAADLDAILGIGRDEALAALHLPLPVGAGHR